MKPFFTIASLVLSLAVFISYYVQMWRRKVRPHIFTWLTWGILLGLGFILSFSAGGGGGAWVFAFQSVLCITVVVWVLARKEIDITKSDWVIFIGALITTIFYVLMRDALLSVILASIIELAGFAPTFRKSYTKPYDEPALTYFFSALSFLFSIGALQTYSPVTLLYPSILVATNFIFILFLFICRRRTA